MSRLLCLLFGHKIKADIVLTPRTGYGYAYHCTRCNRRLTGPRA